MEFLLRSCDLHTNTLPLLCPPLGQSSPLHLLNMVRGREVPCGLLSQPSHLKPRTLFQLHPLTQGSWGKGDRVMSVGGAGGRRGARAALVK